jgi:antitoxin MazE
MKTRIQKWGNSLALRIPKSYAGEVGLVESAAVELSIVEGRLIIAPAKAGMDLAHLLSQVTEQNRHGEVNSGPAVGQEVW